MGTPAFMAPEHAMGAPATELSDQSRWRAPSSNMFESGEPEVMPKPLHEVVADCRARVRSAGALHGHESREPVPGHAHRARRRARRARGIAGRLTSRENAAPDRHNVVPSRGGRS